jgi:ubiquinone/menaquinone biosynthesis C-methylase UbiE
VTASAEALPFRDRSFDLVTVSSGVHWFEPERFQREAARVLRPGGRVLLYEHAAAHLPDQPGFPTWVRETYLRRYPNPARGPMAGAATAGPQLGLGAVDEWLDEIPFTRNECADYLMTQSPVARALERGEPAEAVRSWLLGQLDQFFPAGTTRVFVFRVLVQSMLPVPDGGSRLPEPP